MDLNIINYTLFSKILIFDNLSVIFKFLIIFLSLIFFLIISTLLNDYKVTAFELILFILFNIVGSIFICSSYNLMLIFICLELISFSSYFLIAFKKHCYYSIECGIKYLIISTISGCFFLIGSLLLYYNLGSILIRDLNLLILNLEYLFLNYNNTILKKLLLKIEGFYYYLEFINFKTFLFEHLSINISLSINSSFIIGLSFILIILSIFIKLSMSPFHLWALEVYEKSLSITVFFFTLLGKLTYFIVLFRVYYFLLSSYNFIFNSFILLIIFLSIIFGAFSNLIQKKFKTILVYSSISHIGYILLSFSINSALSLEISYFYLINYLLSNIIIWFTVLNLIKNNDNTNKFSKNITDFTVLNNTNKLVALSLLLVFLSIAGLPPFVGFFSKLGIFLVLISESLFFIVLLILFFTTVSIFYYIRLIKILYFENLQIGKLYIPLNSFNSFILCFFSFTLFFLFINPKLLYLFIHILVL